MRLHDVPSTQFHFLEPKRFYRKLEEIFESLTPGPLERFATSFLSAFYDHLAEALGITAIHLYDRSGGKIRLIKQWGSGSSFASNSLSWLIVSEELPWHGGG